MASPPALPPPDPLPVPRLKELGPGLSLLLPLSRRGTGPGILLVIPDSAACETVILDGIPSPSMKWAEESYVVGQITHGMLSQDAKGSIEIVQKALLDCPQCTSKDRVAIIIYEASAWPLLSSFLSKTAIAAAVVYTSAATPIASSPIPILQHLAGQTQPLSSNTTLKTYHYPSSSPSFALPFQPLFSASAEAVSHTRNLTFLKTLLDGPYFDLEAIWDEHTAYEFEHRSVPHTMATMVQEPYVNHIPTLTGGIGRGPLSRFYADHFVHSNPADTAMELISRTVGVDRVVDEFVFSFTHDRVVDWILPGVPPTMKRVEVPFTAVVNIRGDRLYHEHIAWDQASVLRQIGLLPDYVPWPYNTEGKRKEIRLPVAGAEAAGKMRDKNHVESNLLISDGLRELS